MTTSSYQLLDFGDGEKLEQFGDCVVRRPNLYARRQKTEPRIWADANLRFDEHSQSWIHSSELPKHWFANFEGLKFQLKPTPVGHLGVFPEQYANWNWLRKKCPQWQSQRDAPLKALNLFAYTGGTTMALASSGVEVVHLDGAANTVKWARSNASRSSLGEKPIRWIAEDTMRFLNREIKRGNRYDILVADPPSFGRGPKGEQWRIQRDFPRLISCLSQLMPSPLAVVLSCHTEGFDCQWMARQLRLVFDHGAGTIEKLKLTLSAKDGAQLEAGDCVRWSVD